MGKIVKQSVLVVMLLLYGFAISFCSAVDSTHDAVFSAQHPVSSTESYHSVVSKSLLSHTAPAAPAVQLAKCVSSPSFKYQLADQAGCIRNVNQLLLTEYLQYNFFSKNLLEKLQPHELVFPFHNFW